MNGDWELDKDVFKGELGLLQAEYSLVHLATSYCQARSVSYLSVVNLPSL